MKESKGSEPKAVEIRGARVHNLKGIDVDVPLRQIVGVAGVSGSGKSSLALGVLYAEGSRRYLDSLSTYTRRRIAQSSRASADEVLHAPAAVALRQRPGVPSVHSTFGTSTELLNYLRLLVSRVGNHACPNGHTVEASDAVAREMPIRCPVCEVEFYGPGAEELAFNSAGACVECGGTGIVRRVDESTLVPDESLTIQEGAVASWRQLMWSLMPQVAQEMGVRIDVPFEELTPEEREIVFHGPAEKKHIIYQSPKTGQVAELDFTYFNAVYTVENSLAKAKDEKGIARVAKFLSEQTCPACGGSRLCDRARSSTVAGMSLADIAALTLDELSAWLATMPSAVPSAVRSMAFAIAKEMEEPIARLQQLGLGYLALDRASSTLSTGERQRAQLSRVVRNRTTGVLYVLDEPSIGLHPSNVDGLVGVMEDLVSDGNSVVVVDHDLGVLRRAGSIIEMGPGSGAQGGTVVVQGTPEDIASCPHSLTGPYLSREKKVRVLGRPSADSARPLPPIRMEVGEIHTVKPMAVEIPRGALTAVTGVSGSGKTTLVLESLMPALDARAHGRPLPAHVRSLEADGIARSNLIDARPIGANVRSTVATYSGVLDDLRRSFAASSAAKERGLRAGDFSHNTGSLRCPTCDGTGTVSLDVQFLPDLELPCPDCGGSRYSKEAERILVDGSQDAGGPLSLPGILAMTVDEAQAALLGPKRAKQRLATLQELGLGYLTLGEATPALSGGEAQRLKLASELSRDQSDSVFAFDEPTIGLHPHDVGVLLSVLRRLVDGGATVVVIEHDLDMVANADWVIDLGPGGGEAGGRVVASGTPEEIASCEESVTGRYLRDELG